MTENETKVRSRSNSPVSHDSKKPKISNESTSTTNLNNILNEDDEMTDISGLYNTQENNTQGNQSPTKQFPKQNSSNKVIYPKRYGPKHSGPYKVFLEKKLNQPKKE